MSSKAQQFTRKKPALPKDIAIREHFESVAEAEAEVEEMERRYELNTPDFYHPRHDYQFDDYLDCRDHESERTQYFFDPPSIDDDLVLEDAWADRYEWR